MITGMAIAGGAALGAWGRWRLGLWLNTPAAALPWGTLAANWVVRTCAGQRLGEGAAATGLVDQLGAVAARPHVTFVLTTAKNTNNNKVSVNFQTSDYSRFRVVFHMRSNQAESFGLNINGIETGTKPLDIYNESFYFKFD
jgi:hypothetical protein